MQIVLFSKIFRRSWLVLLLFQLTITNSIYPQISERDEFFAPFVSRLSTEVSDKNINLTWIPSADLNKLDPNSSALIYRLEQKITTNNLSSAKLIATKLNNDGQFEDISLNPGKYYYAVILRDSTGKSYDILIPYRNQTTSAAVIYQIKTISFSSSIPAEDVSIIANESSEIFETGRVNLISLEENSSVDYSNNVRENPLPYLRIDHRVQINSAPLPLDPIIDAVPGWKPAPPNAIKTLLNDSTETAINSLATDTLSNNSLTTVLKPEILPIDRNISKENPDYSLQLIVHQKLLTGKFEDSGRLLMDYLALNHSKETESRIHFYLGQSLFFQKRFSKALIEFLSSENDFKLASTYWIDKTLNEIKKN